MSAGRERGPHAALERIVRASPWFMQALEAVRDLRLDSSCIGAGAVRNLVWDHLHGYPDAPSPLSDIDVAWFDATDLDPAVDAALQARLAERLPGLRWEVTNQAAVHLWFERHFGHPVRPLRSLEDAVASWPEYATSVGVALDDDDALHVIAPYGLDDLFAMRVRRNPARVSVETYRQRTAQKAYGRRWPKAIVVPDDGRPQP